MEFWRSIYICILYIDIFLALASFYFAGVLLYRAYLAHRFGRPDPIYFNFGMTILFLGIWIIGILLEFFRAPLLDPVLLLSATFLPGVWIMHFFVLFGYYYPVPYNKIKINERVLFLTTAIISVTFFIPGLYGLKADLDFPWLRISENPIGTTIFSLYFAFLAYLAFANLYYKYKRLGDIHHVYLKRIILGSMIAVVANFILSNAIYYFDVVNITPIGVLFVFTVLAYIYSILYPDLIKISFLKFS